MTNRVHNYFLLAVMIGSMANLADAQYGDRKSRQRGEGRRGAKKSDLRVILNQQPSSLDSVSSVQIYTQIPLSRLVFINDGNLFTANYELSLFIIDSLEKVAQTRIWNEKVTREKFTETREKKAHHRSYLAVDLAPGKYRVVAHLTDLDNKSRITTRNNLTVEEFPSDTLLMGKPLLLSEKPDEIADAQTILPQADGRISNDADSFFVLLNIKSHTDEPIDAEISYRLESEGDTVVVGTVSLDLGPGITPYVLTLGTQDLTGREYTLDITVKVDDQIAEQTLDLKVDWAGFSRDIDDIDAAVDQARYVADKNDLKAMNAVTGDARREEFLKFWKGMDPTPGTPRNELMDEYYSRVAYSNMKFESFQQGWESDRGMVHIIYGPPDEVIQNPAQGNRRPSTIWHYYDKNWRFVFVDVNMFGDFQLMTPLYPTGGFR